MPNPAFSNATSQHESARHGVADGHIHGFAGVDFATSPLERVLDCIQHLNDRGTRHIIATLPTMAPQALLRRVVQLSPLVDRQQLAGLHLEGPFLSPAAAGAHPSALLLTGDQPEARELLNQLEVIQQRAHRPVTVMTIAPELPGAQEVIDRLLAMGISPSLGHTACSEREFVTACERITDKLHAPVRITHLFNAMPRFHHRDPGLLPAIYRLATGGEAIVELIADTHHVHPRAVQWCFELFADAITLVSDASAATFPAGGHTLAETTGYHMGPIMLSRDPHRNLATVAGRNTLASGACDVPEQLQRLRRAGGIPDAELTAAACRL
ncbi:MULTISPECIES: hypothetical protein [Auritidibacter]|uniref:hypothetical protein n=1 Tax=Auritidibacter TaxID=1160973 RepID=UPI000D72B3CB|nr:MULTISPECIES: hypothetical protein [Auritidibacter]NIH71001.1 N-acetylglucosamine-6-phosphate deacetylase [Auritidibacter ignavus]PXA81995.1 hypothetical protein DCC25_01030 [Auritidibacter sp. NML120636]RMX24159.1 hypothetical protein DYI20_00900 [Auritidibacter ignavus]WGH81796.1 hypothetical protein QDX25_01025 [Auritidibacter ignavus]WGH86405.1 hypothetical protein QDX24_00825 [Auritidibacter ignavus]